MVGRERSRLLGAVVASGVLALALATGPAGAGPAPRRGPTSVRVEAELVAFAAAARADIAAITGGTAGVAPPAAAVGAAAGTECVRVGGADADDVAVLDVAGYALTYDCVAGTWVTGVVTFDPWSDPSLGMFLTSIDTDGNVTGNGCLWGDYQVVGEYAGTLIADVVRTPSCDSATWTSMGAAGISRVGFLDDVGISFSHWQIGSPTSVRVSGDLTPVGGPRDYFPDTGWFEAVVPGAPPTTTTAPPTPTTQVTLPVITVPGPPFSSNTWVHTGYAHEDARLVSAAAAYLGLTNERFHEFGLSALRFITALGGRENVPEPIAPEYRPTVNGPVSYGQYWRDPDAAAAMLWAMPHYGITHGEAQKLGATLLVFLAGIDAARRGAPF